jgi:hypothetical protein
VAGGVAGGVMGGVGVDAGLLGEEPLCGRFPTVRLWIYTEHVLIAGHNGVRTGAWCSYHCETGVASW